MIGLAIFAVASLLGGLAQNEPMLLAARGLQGLGAALASPAALALITTTFPAGPPATAPSPSTPRCPAPAPPSA